MTSRLVMLVDSMSSRSATVMKQFLRAWNQNFAPPASPMRALRCWVDSRYPDALAHATPDTLAATCSPRAMTVLEMYAHHGSTSYGGITPARLDEILRGAAPEREELPRVCQAMTETAGYKAYELAEELGLDYEDLDARTRVICGCGLPL